jgi:hypothetical protein
MKLLRKIKSLVTKKEKPKKAPLFEKIPKNLDGAIASLNKHLFEEDKIKLSNNDSSIHHGFGRNIRNEWGLWRKGTPLYEWFKSQGIEHADDMSAIIFESFRRQRKNQPIDLDKQISHHQNYWKLTKEFEAKGIHTIQFVMGKDGQIESMNGVPLDNTP